MSLSATAPLSQLMLGCVSVIMTWLELRLIFQDGLELVYLMLEFVICRMSLI